MVYDLMNAVGGLLRRFGLMRTAWDGYEKPWKRLLREKGSSVKGGVGKSKLIFTGFTRIWTVTADSFELKYLAGWQEIIHNLEDIDNGGWEDIANKILRFLWRLLWNRRDGVPTLNWCLIMMFRGLRSGRLWSLTDPIRQLSSHPR